MQTEILALALYISAGGLLLLACAILWVVVTAVIWHYFPNCAYIRWINAEVYQAEDLTKYGNVKAGDCISPRSHK